MAELGAGGGSGYPGALDTDSVLESTSTVARSDVPNDLAAAIIAIQTELGTDPAGSSTDVKTNLQTEHAADGTHGVVTATSIDLGSSTVVSGTLDEDDMASDSATDLATQQSIKAYVDDVTEASAKSSGAKTLLVTPTTILTLDLGTVTSGDRYMITGIGHAITKGGTGGTTSVSFGKSSGTATLVFGNDETTINHTQDQAAAAVHAICMSGVMQATGSGTLVLTLVGQSTGSNSTMADGKGQLHAMRMIRG